MKTALSQITDREDLLLNGFETLAIAVPTETYNVDKPWSYLLTGLKATVLFYLPYQTKLPGLLILAKFSDVWQCTIHREI